MKINETIAANMRAWRHSGFSVDNSVKINAGDHTGMQRLVEYIARCPFNLARMVKLTGDGMILYRAAHPNCLPFPLSGDASLMAGIPRNFRGLRPVGFSGRGHTAYSEQGRAPDTVLWLVLEQEAWNAGEEDACEGRNARTGYAVYAEMPYNMSRAHKAGI